MNIVESGVKVDFHIHSIASKHKEEPGKVEKATIENLEQLVPVSYTHLTLPTILLV